MENVEKIQQFIQRKADHLRLSLLDENEAMGKSLLDRIELIHDSLPDLDFADVSIESSFLEQAIQTPFYISGMTAGHADAAQINECFAALASRRGWLMGVGSQRRELGSEFEEGYQDSSVHGLVKKYPKLKLISNFGIAQVIELFHAQNLKKLIETAESVQASAIAIHLNPLQEVIQEEGTPKFKDSLLALKFLAESSPIPIVVKETGSGMSEVTLKKLSSLPLFAVDVSGFGGTHWGRIEGSRASNQSLAAQMGKSFKDWGVSTLESTLLANEEFHNKATEVWASGGVRSGIDAAKLLALGATRVGFAKPVLQAALQGEEELDRWMSSIEQELKISLFCTNTANLGELSALKVKGI